MNRITRFDWNFSSTAETVTGLLLATACALVLFV
jgi:hypothetical protein